VEKDSLVKSLKALVNPSTSVEEVAPKLGKKKYKKSKVQKWKPDHEEVPVEESRSHKWNKPSIRVVELVVEATEQQGERVDVTLKKRKRRLLQGESVVASGPSTPVQKVIENLNMSQIRRHTRSMSK